MQGEMRIYGCGGTGVNIASYFERAAGDAETGHAITHLTYVDTSKSNLNNSLKDEHIFILDGIDGSGKVRRENHEEIAKNVKALLQTHKPADLNIVVFSASGGSGSVFGPLIVKELLERKLPVVSLVIGSEESEITTQNTINTLKSLDAIAAKTQMPVVICYEHNDRDTKRSDVDVAVRSVIGSLSVLTSRQNSELDTRDVTNWVQFNRSTSVGPRLALFDVFNSNEAAEKVQHPIAIASLYKTPDETPIAIAPEYSAVGYPRQLPEKFELLHFVIGLEGVPVITKKLQNRLAELEQARKSRVEHDRLVTDGDKVTDDGLIL